MIEQITAKLKVQFNGRIGVEEKRPGIWQLFIPFYHEDGDMLEIYLQKEGALWRISDFAMSLMRLSYQYDIDSENKEKIFQRIISENGLQEEEGNIFIMAGEEQLLPSLLQFTQGIQKITSMRYFRREVIESLFFDQLEEFIMSDLQDYKPKKEVLPIAERDDLEADFAFEPDGYPVYLFGVKDKAKARLAAICCLEYRLKISKFRSYVVHDDITKMSKKDYARLTSACDKQFTSLEDFRLHAVNSLERER